MATILFNCPLQWVRFTFAGGFFKQPRVFSAIIAPSGHLTNCPAGPAPMMSLNLSIPFLTVLIACPPRSYTHLPPHRNPCYTPSLKTRHTAFVLHWSNSTSTYNLSGLEPIRITRVNHRVVVILGAAKNLRPTDGLFSHLPANAKRTPLQSCSSAGRSGFTFRQPFGTIISLGRCRFLARALP
jgi:hypothetical protein